MIFLQKQTISEQVKEQDKKLIKNVKNPDVWVHDVVSSRTCHKFRDNTASLVLIETSAERTTGMIKYSIISTCKKKFTICTVLIKVYALRSPIAVRHNVTQACVIIGKILTWTCALFSNATFDFSIICAFFRVYIEQQRILTRLQYELAIHAFIITAAVFRINKSVMLVIIRTFQSTLTKKEIKTFRIKQKADW